MFTPTAVAGATYASRRWMALIGEVQAGAAELVGTGPRR